MLKGRPHLVEDDCVPVYYGPGLVLSTLLERRFKIQSPLLFTPQLTAIFLAHPNLSQFKYGAYVDVSGDGGGRLKQRTWA